MTQAACGFLCAGGTALPPAPPRHAASTVLAYRRGVAGGVLYNRMGCMPVSHVHHEVWEPRKIDVFFKRRLLRKPRNFRSAGAQT